MIIFVEDKTHFLFFNILLFQGREKTRSWQTGGFGAAVHIRRLVAHLCARRLSDDYIKGYSVNTFLWPNGNVTVSIKVKLTWQGWIANFTVHSQQPMWWRHLIFASKNIVLTTTAGTMWEWKDECWQLETHSVWADWQWRGEVFSLCLHVLLPGESLSPGSQVTVLTQQFLSDQTGKCLFSWPGIPISVVILSINYEKNKVQLWVDCPGKYTKTFIEATKKYQVLQTEMLKWLYSRQSLDILFLAQ